MFPTISLSNLHKTSDQEVYTQLSCYLLSMDRPSYDPIKKTCKYRTKTGNRCPVGALMTDAQYDPLFDVYGSWRGVLDSPMGKGITREHSYLLGAIQRVHDDYGPLQSLKSADIKVNMFERLKEVADKWDLSFAEVEDYLEKLVGTYRK